MAKKIAVVNNKGGSAKTTSVVNIAGALSIKKPNCKIAIFEGDAQGNASASFRISSNELEDTTYDVFMGTKNPENVVVNAYENIDIIPANNDMNFLEFDMMKETEDQYNRGVYELMQELSVRKIDFSKVTYENFLTLMENFPSPTDNYFNMLDGTLDELDKEYDYIIFDTPPEIKSVTSSILAIADLVVIPFEPELYALAGITNILERIKSIKKEYNPKLEIAGLIATKVRANTKLHSDVTKMVAKFCLKNNIHYYDTEISNSIRFPDSNAYHGVPVTIAKPKNEFSIIYYKLVDEMIEQGVL